MRAGLQCAVNSRPGHEGTFFGYNWFCTSRAISSSVCRRSFSFSTRSSRSRFSVMRLKERLQLGELVVALDRDAMGEVALA